MIWTFVMPPSLHEQIHVLFIDADTGNMIADAVVPADQLPDSFEGDVILPLREARRKILEADPLKAEDFTRAGKLVLIVRKITLPSLPEDS
jgi:hypothetical protein